MAFNLHSERPGFRLAAPSLPKTLLHISLPGFRLAAPSLPKTLIDDTIKNASELEVPPQTKKGETAAETLLDLINAFKPKLKEHDAITLQKRVMKLCGKKRVYDIISFPREVLDDDGLLFELFEVWMDEFDIIYESEWTKRMRFETFKHNVFRYHELNTTLNMKYRLARHADKLPGMIFVGGAR